MSDANVIVLRRHVVHLLLAARECSCIVNTLQLLAHCFGDFRLRGRWLGARAANELREREHDRGDGEERQHPNAQPPSRLVRGASRAVSDSSGAWLGVPTCLLLQVPK